MAAQILDGKVMSASLRAEITQRVQQLKEQGVTPGLAVILVGNDPASEIYVRNKGNGCAETGMYSRTINMPADTTQEALEGAIEELNADPAIHGILVQLPLPKHLDEQAALAKILPGKDVDGFHLINAGHMLTGTEGVVACTPRGALYMIKQTGLDLNGKEAVVIGRSNIVGKPMAMLLLRENCTVTICHSRTQNLKEHTRQIPGIQVHELFESRIYLIAGRDDPLAEKNLIREEDLYGRTLMVGGGSPLALKTVQHRLISTGKIDYFNSADHDTTLTNVAAGRGVCLAPGFLNDHSGQFAWIPFDCEEHFSCVLCTHKEDQRDSLRSFLSILTKLYADAVAFPL